MTRLRVSANILLLIGQYTLLNYDVKLGISIKLVAFCILLPCMLKLKLYDVVCLMAAFQVIELHKLSTFFI